MRADLGFIRVREADLEEFKRILSADLRSQEDKELHERTGSSLAAPAEVVFEAGDYRAESVEDLRGLRPRQRRKVTVVRSDVFQSIRVYLAPHEAILSCHDISAPAVRDLLEQVKDATQPLQDPWVKVKARGPSAAAAISCVVAGAFLVWTFMRQGLNFPVAMLLTSPIALILGLALATFETRRSGAVLELLPDIQRRDSRSLGRRDYIIALLTTFGMGAVTLLYRLAQRFL